MAGCGRRPRRLWLRCGCVRPGRRRCSCRGRWCGGGGHLVRRGWRRRRPGCGGQTCRRGDDLVLCARAILVDEVLVLGALDPGERLYRSHAGEGALLLVMREYLIVEFVE